MRERADVLLERQQQLLADLSKSGSASSPYDDPRSDLWSSPKPAPNWDPSSLPRTPDK
jgi:hypothetical protein